MAASVVMAGPLVSSPPPTSTVPSQNQRIAPPGLNQMPGANSQNNNGQYNNNNGQNNFNGNGQIVNTVPAEGNIPTTAPGNQPGTPQAMSYNDPQAPVPYNGQQPGGVPGSSPYNNPQSAIPYNNGGQNSPTNHQPMLTNSPPPRCTALTIP